MMKTRKQRRKFEVSGDRAIVAATPSVPTQPSLPSGVASSLARILRPQAAYRWLLPQLAAITPQYIEMTLRGALAGNHVQAWELFDLMEDTWPKLGKNLNELKNGVRNMKPTFEAYAEEDEDPTPEALQKCALVKAAWANMKPVAAADENTQETTIFDILDAWAKGVSVLEVEWHQFESKKLGIVFGPRTTYWVHPVCYAWNVSGVLGLRADARGNLSPGMAANTLTSQAQPYVIAEFPPEKFLIGIHKHKSGTALGGPMLRPLCWWWLAANFSADWMLNLAQLFGLPFRWASYDRNASDATIIAIGNMLQNMGTAGWGAFPEGSELKFLEAGKNADHSPQADMLDRADKNCDLLILGQTLTSDTGQSGKGGGSLALGKVHEGVKGEIIEACCRYAADVLNTQLFPSILRINFGEDSECPRVKFETEKEDDLVQKSTVVANLAPSAGAAIPLSYINDAFNIPTPKDGEPTLATRATEPPKLPETKVKPAGDPAAAKSKTWYDNLPGAEVIKSREAANFAHNLSVISAIKGDSEFSAALLALTKTL
jgi:phage gp29-like protein